MNGSAALEVGEAARSEGGGRRRPCGADEVGGHQRDLWLRGGLPERFPLSADLMIRRIETILTACLAQALGLPETMVQADRRDGSLTALAPFASGASLAGQIGAWLLAHPIEEAPAARSARAARP